jgi:Flp pilus assembly protein TadD
LLALGRREEAVETFRDALKLDAGNPDAHVGLGRALEGMGNTEEARRHYLTALEIHPGMVQANYILGNLAIGQPGKLDEAVAHYEAAVRGDPAFAEAHANLGAALLGQGRVEMAIEHERAATQLEPTLVPAWVHLGRALAAKGRKQEAAVAFKAALQLTRHDPQGVQAARQIQEWLDLLENDPSSTSKPPPRG